MGSYSTGITKDRWLEGRVAVDTPRTGSGLTLATITANATVNTKGDYADVIASTGGQVSLCRLRFGSSFTAAEDSSMLLDVAYGAAASETVILANLQVGWGNTIGAGVAPREVWFPTPLLPASTRIAARVQAATKVGGTVDRTVLVSADTFNGTTPGTINTIGATTATSQGTAVVAGLSDVEGSWTEITASTTATYRALLYAVGCAGDATTQLSNYLLDIGTGASSSETAILSNIYVSTSTSELVLNPTSITPIPVNIPTGTRLSARLQSSQASAQSLDITLFGIR